MVQKTKLVIIAALLGLSLASPAHSQAPGLAYGTGNLMPTYFGDDGDLRFGNPPSHGEFTEGRKALYNYAKVGRKHAGNHS